jgi:SAM-dependent methyltransferase
MEDAAIHRSANFEKHIEAFATYADVRGLSVLEIGSSANLYVARRFEELGAASVFATNITPVWPQSEKVSAVVAQVRADMTRLSETFEPNSLDLMFGMAVAEHVPTLWVALEEAAKVLKPGGILYLHGGPIWTFNRGHHVLSGFHGPEFEFSKRQCPILKWEHLMHDRQSFAAALVARGASTELAERLAVRIYDSNKINRFGHNRLCRIFESGPLRLLQKIEYAFGAPDASEYERIRRGPWGDEGGFHVSGLTFVMKK